MTSTNCAVPGTQTALSIEPVAGSSAVRAATNASSDNSSTTCKRSRASTAPVSGTSSDQSPSLSCKRRRREGCRSSSACKTMTTSSCVTADGA
ncbi:Uncharacterised protein [Mycobacteroides abscessus subsp. abscessus]|nr:Uncharacterised protein [Mycobacteroides abscessus subsp. abscessus]